MGLRRMTSVMLCALSAAALPGSYAFASDPYAERAALARRYAHVGVTMAVDDRAASGQALAERMGRWMPALNVLSERTSALVSSSSIGSGEEMSRALRSGRYRLAYVGADLVETAARAGYRPVARSNDLVESVLVTAAHSPAASLPDFRGQRVAAADSAVEARLAQFAFHRAGVASDMHWVRAAGEGRTLLGKIERGLADAAVMDRATAEMLMRERPGRYRVAARVGAVPARMLMVAESAHGEPVTQRVVRAVVGLNRASASDLAVLRALGVSNGGFNIATSLDMEWIREVFETSDSSRPAHALIMGPVSAAKQAGNPTYRSREQVDQERG